MDARSHWQALDALFHAARDRPPAARAAFLTEACPEDPALRAEVEAMLEAEAPEHALAIERLVPDPPAAPASDPIVGMRLGPWKVVDVLGHGGMGTVYLAERADGQYRQRVALKLVPGAAAGPQSSRFAVELEALARLTHPNIAHLIDAGTTPEGSPYLVMEFVDGQPITAACDAGQLSVADRLRLFRVVCEATQHAHQALVVHRDLKPSNIFVSRSGEVKLLDFGIAKLLEPEGRAVEATESAWRALTPAYAAPEQLRGQPVTTATDVYVLGAVLFELLTGLRPSGATGDIRLPAPPTAPSAAVARLAASRQDDATGRARDTASARATTPARLARELSGDIDRVVQKAIDPEPGRRYGSAGQLGDEIGRLIEGRPVLARPASAAYRTRRFLLRHRWGTAATAVLVALLAAFGVLAVRQAIAVAEERNRARQQSQRAERVSRLLGDLFSLAGAAPAGGDAGPPRAFLDTGAERIATELAGDPATQAELFSIVGRVYGNLALHTRGTEVLERALLLQRQSQPDGSLAQAETLKQLGDLLILRSDFQGAERRLREALVLQRALDAPPADRARTLVALGRTLGFQNSNADARPLLAEAVDTWRRMPDAPPSDLMAAVYELGMVYHRSGDLALGERYLREAVEIGRAIRDPSPAKVEALMGLARLRHRFQRDAAGAEPVYREALQLARSLYEGDHQDVATCLGELARDVRDQGRLAEAETFARQSLEMFTRLYGATHRETAISTQTLASIQHERGRTAEAVATQRVALASAVGALGEGNPIALGARRALSGLLEAAGRMDEALALRTEELRIARAAFGQGDVYTAIALSGLGDHWMLARRPVEAVAAYRSALAVRTALHPAGHPRIADARAALEKALAAAGPLRAEGPERQ
ncbi:MAG: tetratricopeptide repeat protein [Vicinamibacterales bacterium]